MANEKAKYAVLVKLEGTKGVREADMSAAVPVYAEGDPLIASPEFDTRTRKPLSQYSGNELTSVTKEWSRLPFSLSTPLPLVIASYDGSWIDLLFRASGLKRTEEYETPGDDQTPVASYTYTPVTDPTESLSVDIVGTDRKFMSHGAAAAMSISSSVPDDVMVSFSVSSSFDDMEEGTFTPSYAEVPRTSKIDASNEYGHFYMGGACFESDEFELDMGADIQQKRAWCVGRGNAFVMADYLPKITVKGFKDQTNEYSIDAALNGDQTSFVITIKDPTQLTDAQDPTTGKVKWVITVPVAILDDVPTPSEKIGYLYLSKVFSCRPTTGDDNFSITYYI